MEKKKQSKKQKKRLREEKGVSDGESPPVQKRLNSSALKPALLHNISEHSNGEAISSEPQGSLEAGECEVSKKALKSSSLNTPVLPGVESPCTPYSLSKKAKRKLAKIAQGELVNGSDCNISSPSDIKSILTPETHIVAEAKNEDLPVATFMSAKSCEENFKPAPTSDSAGCSKDIVLKTNTQINGLIDPRDQIISSLKQSVSRLTEENKSLVKELSALKDSSEKLKNGLYCAICLNYYHVPHNLECGHVFCFCCIRDWLTTLVFKGAKLHCPLCRLKVEKTPNFVLALHLHLIETLELEESKHPKVIASITEHMNRYEDESKKWQNIFPDCGIRTTLWDGDDDVARCTTCNWEVVGKSCANCGATYSGDSEK
ncbi:E3 ubiquitin ligase [Entomophthora muscae]|uniref:E3 ubiquitin ligase n=1 Tax=Entomophthora muscae TaxID=34485 RepID=A0ACC2T2G1_9FUNG|nr:E3 ubiquitin ligase [Entomophthora muscae]